MAKKSSAGSGLTDLPADAFEQRRPGDLRPYARNARKHPPEQIEALAASFREFGFVGLIVIDENDEILAGHGRQAAAIMAELEFVPCFVARNWPEEKKRRFRLMDNRLAENSTWDDDLLSLELGDLRDEGVELDGMGFATADLDRLLKLHDDDSGDAESGGAQAPTDFPSFDETIKTDHCCPSCGYKWSGKADSAGKAAPEPAEA